MQARLEVVAHMGLSPRQNVRRALSGTSSLEPPCAFSAQSALHGRIFQGLGGIDGRAWPAGVLDYAEVRQEGETAAA